MSAEPKPDEQELWTALTKTTAWCTTSAGSSLTVKGSGETPAKPEPHDSGREDER